MKDVGKICTYWYLFLKVRNETDISNTIQQLKFNQGGHVAISISVNERGIIMNVVYYLAV